MGPVISDVHLVTSAAGYSPMANSLWSSEGFEISYTVYRLLQARISYNSLWDHFTKWTQTGKMHLINMASGFAER